MKKSMKKLLSLVMVIAAFAALTVPALAADAVVSRQGTNGLVIETTGSGYTDTDLFGNFKNVMPGDELTENITIKNNVSGFDYVKLYIRAEAHDEEGNPLTYSEPFENEDGHDQANIEGMRDETVVTMADFLSKLTMEVYLVNADGTKQSIFSASPDETAQLTDNVLLGTFAKGKSAKLEAVLTVPAELGNEYAYRVGEVDWVFTVNGFSDDLMIVRKVWSDASSNVHDNDVVKANLICDGKVVCTKELTKEHGWTETFSKLRDGGIDDLNIENHTWKIEEAEVPYDYTVSYSTDGNVTIITNTRNHHVYPDYDTDITVNKKWSNDAGYKRPKYALATLYSGDKAIETVRLDASNGWSYSWKKLPAGGNWHVLESSVPAGYTPVYSATGDVVTITNTARLIQTGQLNWPVPVLAGLGFALGAAGAILVILGGIVLLKKRKNA